MDPNHHELILAELRCARDRLRAARALLDTDLVPDTISRAYYATFHAAKALLIYHGLHAESHAGLKALFGLHLVDKCKVDRQLGRILSELMERRESADYDVWTGLDLEDARRSVSDADHFVSVVESLVASR